MKISFSKQTKERAFKQLYEEYYAPFCLYAKGLLMIKKHVKTSFRMYSPHYGINWILILWSSIEHRISLHQNVRKNSCLNFLKHQEYEWSYAENIQKKAPVYETEPDSIYTLDELYRMLYETLNKLPENYRTVFIKSFFEGKTHTEIAEEMNLSVKSINRYKQKRWNFYVMN